MFRRIFGMIRGVPESTSEAAGGRQTLTVRPQQTESDYLPESAVPEGGIEGVADDGSCWELWRIDANGERWFRRLSDDRFAAAEIRGIAPDEQNDSEDEDDDDFSGDDDTDEFDGDDNGFDDDDTDD